MQPNRIECQELDYIRHGTANLLAALVVYNGRMWAECLDKSDGEHFRAAVRCLLHPYTWAKPVHLVIDQGPSHTSGDTTAFFRDLAPRVRVLFTPVDASWLNQVESLLNALSARYLLRGSWDSRCSMAQHVLSS